MPRLSELFIADVLVSRALDIVETEYLLCVVEPLGGHAVPRSSEVLVADVPVSSA